MKKGCLIIALLLVSISAVASENCTLQERRYLPEIDYAINGTRAALHFETKNWQECFYLGIGIAQRSIQASVFSGKVQFTTEVNGFMKTEANEGEMNAIHYYDWSFENSHFLADSKGSVTAFTGVVLKNQSIQGSALYTSNLEQFKISPERHEQTWE